MIARGVGRVHRAGHDSSAARVGSTPAGRFGTVDHGSEGDVWANDDLGRTWTHRAPTGSLFHPRPDSSGSPSREAGTRTCPRRVECGSGIGAGVLRVGRSTPS